jgi:flavorubredoxin
METRIDEIAERIYRLSTYVPEIAAPAGFTFNQFLVDAEAPLLFHCGPRAMFPRVSEAAAKILPLDKIRWISFGHVEADECGSMNQWLQVAPMAQVAQGRTACLVSLNDLADRPPHVLADGETIDLGGRRMRFIDTPHVPHGWEAGVMYEETTRTLLCGDLFTHTGNVAPLTRDDIVAPAIAAEEMFQASALTPTTAPTIRKLASLAPSTLALMHGASFAGDGAAALHALADFYAARMKAAERLAA